MCENKICTQCKISKSRCSFHKCNKAKDGTQGICKDCKKLIRSQSKKYEPIAQGTKVCTSCSIELNVSEFGRDTKIKDGLRNVCLKCNASKSRVYKKENKSKVRDYEKNRLLNNPLLRLALDIRRLVGDSFKRACKGKYTKPTSTENILNCSILELIEHLQSLFTEGMTLDNHGQCVECWHIDHKIPLASAKTEDGIVKLNHYTNLQPMWSRENLSKGKKY